MSGQPTIGSLFTGAARLDRAVEARFGARTVWYAEHEPATEKNPRPKQAAARLLAQLYPDIPNLGDVGLVDWSAVEPVDIETGGFPCQDLSLAGAREGLRHARNRSGQWAHMLASVEALRPSVVVIENVRGLLSARTDPSDLEPCPWCLGDLDPELAVRALGVVLGGLADVGYDAAWTGLRAADVGAAHGRFRVFILAWRRDGGRDWIARHAAHLVG